MYKGWKPPQVIERGVSQVRALRSQDVSAREKDKDKLVYYYMCFMYSLIISERSRNGSPWAQVRPTSILHPWKAVSPRGIYTYSLIQNVERKDPKISVCGISAFVIITNRHQKNLVKYPINRVYTPASLINTHRHIAAAVEGQQEQQVARVLL